MNNCMILCIECARAKEERACGQSPLCYRILVAIKLFEDCCFFIGNQNTFNFLRNNIRLRNKLLTKKFVLSCTTVNMYVHIYLFTYF